MELTAEKAKDVFTSTSETIKSSPPYSPNDDECSFISGIIFGELVNKNEKYQLFLQDFCNIVKYINGEIPSFTLSNEGLDAVKKTTEAYLQIDPELSSLLDSCTKLRDSVK